MPVQPCQKNMLPGFKFGKGGKCFTYKPGDEKARARAREKAARQGRAIKASQARRGRPRR